MIPINANGNCTSDLLGTGSRSCDIQSFGDVIGFNLHPKGWSMNVATDTISATTWTDQIKAFNTLPFNGIYDFAQDTPENEVATSSTGIESTIRLGKPKFTYNFDRGGCFHKALFDKRGKNRWDISLNFEEGILLAMNESETTVGGFDAGRFDVPTFRLQQGTDPQQSAAIMQFVDAIQFNTKFTFIPWSKLGVNLSKIEGVIETYISYTVNPSAGTTFALRVAGACNTDDILAVFDSESDWRLGGTQATPRTITSVAYRPATKDYLFTLSGALVDGDTVEPTLAGTTYDVVSIDGDGIYKGKAPLFTVGG